MGSLLKKAMQFCNDWREDICADPAESAVSIIVPAYFPNHLDSVIRHLQAIGGYSEIIIVDDSGVGNIASYGDNIRTVHHRANLGRSAARNTGAAYAKSDILLFIDQDMYLSPDLIRQMKRCFSSNNGHAVVMGLRDTAPYEKIPSVEKWTPPPPSHDWRREVIVTENMIDLTASGTGSINNHCRKDQKLHIYNESDSLRNLGIAPETTLGFWDLAGMVISHSLAISRDDFFAVGGFPEWIEGWGGEDIVLGFLLIAYGIPIILTEAVSYQEKHRPYSGSEEKKMCELRSNILHYREWVNTVSGFPRLDKAECIARTIPLR